MIKRSALTFGIIFHLLGILSFFNNPVIGSGGIFLIEETMSAFYIISGGLLLYTAYKTKSFAFALKLIGLFYLLLALIGILATIESGSGELLGITIINSQVNWLHLLLGILMYLLSMSE